MVALAGHGFVPVAYIAVHANLYSVHMIAMCFRAAHIPVGVALLAGRLRNSRRKRCRQLDETRIYNKTFLFIPSFIFKIVRCLLYFIST